MDKKYKLTDEKIKAIDRVLYRIEALRDFGNVKKGDKGGYIEKEENLSHDGNAWVCNNARVYGNALICDNAWVCNDAWVYGNARICDEAWVYHNAQVYGDALVYDDAQVYDNALVYDSAWVYENVQVCDSAKVYGYARVYGNARICNDAQMYGYVPSMDRVSLPKDAFNGYIEKDSYNHNTDYKYCPDCGHKLNK